MTGHATPDRVRHDLALFAYLFARMLPAAFVLAVVILVATR